MSSHFLQKEKHVVIDKMKIIFMLSSSFLDDKLANVERNILITFHLPTLQ